MNQPNQQPILFAVGINHKTAPIEVREQIFVHEAETTALIAELKKTLNECVVISTCNRTEIYGVTTRVDLDLDFYKDLLIKFKGAEANVRREHFFGMVSCAACQQLFRVATSIDSKIVGDVQILGQVRDAYALAKNHTSTGKILNQLFQRGFKLGKLTRTQTNLHKGAVSISMAAVESAAETFSSLHDKTVLIIGAGETARLTANCLIKKRVGKIIFTNRTRTHGEELLADLQKSHHFTGETIEFSDFKKYLNETDIVISSTSAPEPILNAEDFTRQKNKILLIDIAMPRDIASEVGEMPNVVLKNIDDLHAIIDKNYQRRMNDLPQVKKNIMVEMSDFLVWYYSLPLLPATLEGGAKPNDKILHEIVGVKKFLLENVSFVHKLAMQNGAENFAGHVKVVEKLVEMKQTAFAEKGLEVEA